MPKKKEVRNEKVEQQENNKTRKISLRLSENTLNTLDEVVERMGFLSRSTLIRLLMSQKKIAC